MKLKMNFRGETIVLSSFTSFKYPLSWATACSLKTHSGSITLLLLIITLIIKIIRIK